MIRNMVLKRIGSALLALLLSSVVIFLLVRLAPGDPINLVLGEGPGDIGVNTELLEERRESLREAHGLNDSIPVQYANWFKKIITLDMGTSIRSGRPITQELWSRVPATFTLALAALFIETILKFRSGSNQSFSGSISLELSKVLDETTSQIFCFFIPLSRICISDTRLKNFRINAR